MLHKQYLTRDQFQGNLTKMTRWSNFLRMEAQFRLTEVHKWDFLNTLVQGTTFWSKFFQLCTNQSYIFKGFFFFFFATANKMKYMKQMNSGVDIKTFTLTPMDGSQNIVPLSSLIIIKDLAVLFLDLMEEHLLFLIVCITSSLH